jgi:L-threonylcarbamoyladenylate synthase
MSIISNCTESDIREAAASLKSGNLVAFPTETVYGLGADATNKDAVARVYKVKGRPADHPLIVHISSAEYLDTWARDIPEYAIKLARSFWPGPMTLILPRKELAKDFITGGQDNVGVRVPSHTVALALLKQFEARGGLGVAAPSANRFGKVSPTTAEAVKIELENFINSKDIIIDGGPSIIGVESTIIDCTQYIPIILRPGAITKNIIKEVSGISIIQNITNGNQIKASGLLQSHYAPLAKVFLAGYPGENDGFIALSHISTPMGAIRLAMPKNNVQYAHQLYNALRLADQKQLQKVFVVPPSGDDIAVAIRDRLYKAANLNELNI